MKDTHEILIPFAGFYNSWHDSELDQALDTICSNDSGKIYTSIRDLCFTNIDWSLVYREYAREYTELFAIKFNLPSLKFLRLMSPKYYNFETDRILASIDSDDLAKLSAYRTSETLTKLVKKQYTSCSGFVSHYPNTVSAWPTDLADWDHNQLKTLLEAYMLDCLGVTEDWELGLLEDLNEVAYRIVSNAITEPRVYRLLDCLRAREERAYR